ncbi:MAG: 4Fe-4S binding protein [Spirochaetes bacterium]|nr:4Fe-4S binding protein [Spirochaetota bacterium]
MKLHNSLYMQDKIFRLRINLFGLALLLIIIGSIAQYKFEPGRWMTYRNFDYPEEINFINYLNPGVKDVSTGKTYDFTQKHFVLFFAVIFFFFPFMFFLRVLADFDFKRGVYRYITQWLTFVVARLGILRVTGICPVKRSGLGVFPFMNCQSCELATGACPLGTFQMSLLKKQIPFVLAGQIILVGILSGRTVCGWLCPYGFLSDIFDKLPGKRIKLHLNFTYFKYVFLGIFLISSIAYFFKDQSKTLLYCSYLCPVGFYYGVLEYALTTGLHSLIKDFPFIHFMLFYHFFIGALVIVGTIKLGGRFFCKFFCPLGTLYGLFNKIALFNIRLNENRCTGCKACEKVCPMQISILNQKLESKSNCIVCGRCKVVCPTKKIDFSVQLFGKKRTKPITANKPNQQFKVIKRANGDKRLNAAELKVQAAKRKKAGKGR